MSKIIRHRPTTSEMPDTAAAHDARGAARVARSPATTLIDTENWLLEIDAPRYLSITNRQTGLTAMVTGKRIAGDVRDCLKTHSPDKVGACYARIANGAGAPWQAVYKRLPPVGGHV